MLYGDHFPSVDAMLETEGNKLQEFRKELRHTPDCAHCGPRNDQSTNPDYIPLALINASHFSTAEVRDSRLSGPPEGGRLYDQFSIPQVITETSMAMAPTTVRTIWHGLKTGDGHASVHGCGHSNSSDRAHH